jgi:SAM-dependent methyltransferase
VAFSHGVAATFQIDQLSLIRNLLVPSALASGLVITLGLGALYLQQSSCARPSPAAASAPLREPDVPYEPSPQHVVTEILRLGAVGPKDLLFDLGCGDGRIVIAAVREHGARGVCIDIDPQRIREARANAKAAGVEDRIDFRTQDLFEADLSGATVVTLFLWPEVNLKLRPKLRRELQPGTRVVSYWHDMGDWRPDRTIKVIDEGEEESVYLWTIRARE